MVLFRWKLLNGSHGIWKWPSALCVLASPSLQSTLLHLSSVHCAQPLPSFYQLINRPRYSPNGSCLCSFISLSPPPNPAPHLYSAGSLVTLFGLGLKVLFSSVVAWFYVTSTCQWFPMSVIFIFNKMVLQWLFTRYHLSALTISITRALLCPFSYHSTFGKWQNDNQQIVGHQEIF